MHVAYCPFLVSDSYLQLEGSDFTGLLPFVDPVEGWLQLHFDMVLCLRQVSVCLVALLNGCWCVPSWCLWPLHDEDALAVHQTDIARARFRGLMRDTGRRRLEFVPGSRFRGFARESHSAGAPFLPCGRHWTSQVAVSCGARTCSSEFPGRCFVALCASLDPGRHYWQS